MRCRSAGFMNHEENPCKLQKGQESTSPIANLQFRQIPNPLLIISHHYLEQPTHSSVAIVLIIRQGSLSKSLAIYVHGSTQGSNATTQAATQNSTTNPHLAKQIGSCWFLQVASSNHKRQILTIHKDNM